MALKDYYNENDDSDNHQFDVLSWLSMCFIATSSYKIGSVKLKLFKVNSPGIATISIRATTLGAGTYQPTGADLTVGTTNGDTLTADTAGEWREITFNTTLALTSGVAYAIVARAAGTNPNRVGWRRDTAEGYTNGNLAFSSNSGSSWTKNDDDYMFENYGVRFGAIDKSYTKSLVAIGNNEVWYESSPGSMSELSVANGDFDVTNALEATGAFGKIFMANQTNLKVGDFVNIKLASSTLSATNPPDFGTTLSGNGSGAEMIVDYSSSLTGTAGVYGKLTTAASFVSTDTVSGTDDDGNAVSFTLTAPQDNGPHWYNWTTFGNSSVFGTMPSSVYMVCRYRGRLVIAGHPDYPHQWYMSRVANPWDWLYGTLDPLSAVAGNNADAGEMGDIIRALIPYGDDYLVFGGANTIWLLDGDPASGGSLDQISDTTGIFSPYSWCKDDNNNLYFWGTGGLYKMEGGRSKPVNLSIKAYPNWVNDWALDLSEHRLTLSYDPHRHGIIISKTALDDATNENYWYDLRTGGLFPETYPTECGVFYSFYYDADDSDYRAMLFACNDGYIRYFSDSAKSDNTGTPPTAISSYMALAPFAIGDGVDREGKIKQIVLESSGGASGGDFSDTDGFSYGVYVADDAETCIEDVRDATVILSSANLTDDITGTGRKSRIRQKIRGQYGTIVLANSTISTAFAINRVMVEKDAAGRLKDN